MGWRFAYLESICYFPLRCGLNTRGLLVENRRAGRRCLCGSDTCDALLGPGHGGATRELSGGMAVSLWWWESGGVKNVEGVNSRGWWSLVSYDDRPGGGWLGCHLGVDNT